ncbi:MAG: YbaN family protein [Noviherbaspirillum sp.]
MKILFTIAGCVALALAIAGLFLPLLPTTPFLLLASACYLRGSRRLHRWLHGNRIFGIYLSNYEQHRAIPRRAKAWALVLLWLSMSYSIWLVGPLPLKLMLAAIALSVTIFLLRMKTMEAVRG